jgi:hypothetical protein
MSISPKDPGECIFLIKAFPGASYLALPASVRLALIVLSLLPHTTVDMANALFGVGRIFAPERVSNGH